MSVLILLRHGQSEWNLCNQFTGWVDIPLTERGMEEAREAGKQIKDIPIDMIFTSTLVRAHQTLLIAMLHHESGKIPVFTHTGEGKLEEWGKIYSEEARQQCIPVYTAWQLNERMYGELQGLNKQATAEKFGVEQVKVWRRSYDTAPPKGESLQMTAARTIPYFEQTILPRLEEGKNVLVSAHGNSLRSIIMDLDGLSKEAVLELEIGTGVPIVYNYRDGKLEKGSL